MEAFSERSMDTYFEFSLLLFFIVLILSTVIGVAFGAALHWAAGLGGGVGVFCLLYAILGKCRYLLRPIFKPRTDIIAIILISLLPEDVTSSQSEYTFHHQLKMWLFKTQSDWACFRCCPISSSLGAPFNFLYFFKGEPVFGDAGCLCHGTTMASPSLLQEVFSRQYRLILTAS